VLHASDKLRPDRLEERLGFRVGALAVEELLPRAALSRMVMRNGVATIASSTSTAITEISAIPRDRDARRDRRKAEVDYPVSDQRTTWYSCHPSVRIHSS